MATESQIKANRKNAQKSTGPRTEEGKLAVSQNAMKHGLCSCKNVIRSESQLEYDVFYDEMIADLSPAGAMELMLAERIVNLSWRLKRAEVFQNAVIESFSDDILYNMCKYYPREKEQAIAGDMSLLLGSTIRKDFANNKILEQLLIYEKRIESSLYKATAELRKVQKMRRKEEELLADGRETRHERRMTMENGRETIDEGGCTMEEVRDTRDEPRETDPVKQSQFDTENRIQNTGNRNNAEQSQSSFAETMEDKFQ